MPRGDWVMCASEAERVMRGNEKIFESFSGNMIASGRAIAKQCH